MKTISIQDYKNIAKPRNKKAEANVHVQVCNYIDIKYPDVIYTSDQSGLKMSIGLAVAIKKTRSKNYKIPDLIILKPSNGFNGLVIEIKKSHDEVYKKDGQMRESEHIQAQKESLKKLSEDGYMAVFGCGYDDCIKIIDIYFGRKCIKVDVTFSPYKN